MYDTARCTTQQYIQLGMYSLMLALLMLQIIPDHTSLGSEYVANDGNMGLWHSHCALRPRLSDFNRHCFSLS